MRIDGGNPLFFMGSCLYALCVMYYLIFLFVALSLEQAEVGDFIEIYEQRPGEYCLQLIPANSITSVT